MKLGGLKASAVGIGAWQAGGRAWAVDKGELAKAYARAFELGINFVDTAEVYGAGESEKFVGRIVREFGDVVVATKVAGYNWGRVEKAARASLERLGRIDLLQLHYPPPFYAPLCKTIRDMEKLAEQGAVAEIGVSNFDAGLLRRAAECLKRREIVSNQVEYNLFNRAAESEEFKRAAAELGVKIIAWSPLAKGAVLGRWGKDFARRMDPAYRKAASPAGRELVKLVGEMAARLGASPAQVALAWLIRKGALPIPGVKTVRQAEDAAAAMRLQLSDADVSALDEASGRFAAGRIGLGGIRYVPGFLQRIILQYIPI